MCCRLALEMSGTRVCLAEGKAKSGLCGESKCDGAGRTCGWGAVMSPRGHSDSGYGSGRE